MEYLGPNAWGDFLDAREFDTLRAMFTWSGEFGIGGGSAKGWESSAMDTPILRTFPSEVHEEVHFSLHQRELKQLFLE